MGEIEELALNFRVVARHADAVQTRCEQWVQAQLERRLSELISELVDEEDLIVEIGEIVLNVGDIPLSHFEEVLEERMLEKIETVLRQYLYDRDGHARTGATLATCKVGKRADSEGSLNMGEEGYFNQSDIQDGRLSEGLPALVTYLRTGRCVDFECWLPPRSPNAWLREQLASPEAPPYRFALAALCLQASALRRVLHTFDVQTCRMLACWLDSENVSVLPWESMLTSNRAEIGVALVLSAWSCGRRGVANRGSSDGVVSGSTLRIDTSVWSVLRAEGIACGLVGSAVFMSDAGGKFLVAQVERLMEGGAVFDQLDDLYSLVELVGGKWINSSFRSTICNADYGAMESHDADNSMLPDWLNRLRKVVSHRGLMPGTSAQRSRFDVMGGQEELSHVSDVANGRPERLRVAGNAEVRSERASVADAISQGRDLPGAGAVQTRAERMSVSDAVDRQGASVRSADAVYAPIKRLVVGTPPAEIYAKPIVQTVPNAGLVMLWPLLPKLFREVMLTDETHQFADVGSRERALLVLDWLAWGEEVFAEWRAPVSGLLAGWPDDDVPENQRLEPSLQTQLDAWLSCALDDVTLLAGFSVPELREMFLQRTGTLRFDEGRPVLSVEREAIDILLHEIPWPLTQVALPWMLQPLQVEWM